MKTIDYRVLLFISRHSTSLESLALTLARSVEEMSSTIDDLRKRGLVYLYHGNIDVTVDGRALCDEAARNPLLARWSDVRTWRDEALTGITRAGERSTIDRAVLPTRPELHVPHDPEAQVMAELAELAFAGHLARTMSLGRAEVQSMLATGEIDYCTRCREWRVFGRHSTRPGGWQQYCRACMAAAVRASRQKDVQS